MIVLTFAPWTAAAVAAYDIDDAVECWMLLLLFYDGTAEQELWQLPSSQTALCIAQNQHKFEKKE